MHTLKILYVSSQITPFLNTAVFSDFVKSLPQAMQKKGIEVRILVPRFGLINEKKNKLHEVVRLSGKNIMIGKNHKELTIKVASIPSTKLQVYFIDNEEYFSRKTIFFNKENKFYNDNNNRTIFFCKSALITVKNLQWPPDIIHCNDWITSLIPVYLKTIYKDDLTFKDVKSILTLYNDHFSEKFDNAFMKKLCMKDLKDDILAPLKFSDLKGLIKIGAQHADITIKTDGIPNLNFNDLFDEVKATYIKHDDNGIETYYDLYKKLAANYL